MAIHPSAMQPGANCKGEGRTGILAMACEEDKEEMRGSVPVGYNAHKMQHVASRKEGRLLHSRWRTCWLDGVGSRRIQLPHSPMLVHCAIVSVCRRVGVSLGYACPARMIYPNTVNK